MLYKYRKFRDGGREFVRQLLLNHEMWASKALDLNDEFDCAPIVHVQTDVIGIAEQNVAMVASQKSHFAIYNYAKLKNDPLELQHCVDGAVEDVRKQIAVLSLSRKPDIYKLWNEYSDGFRGVCFGFSCSGKGNILKRAEPVKYVEKWPDLKLKKKASRAEVNRVLNVKLREWHEEDEVRLIGVGEGPVKYLQGSLKQVIFGEHCDPEDRASVVEWLAEGGHSPKLYEAGYRGCLVHLIPVSV